MKRLNFFFVIAAILFVAGSLPGQSQNVGEKQSETLKKGKSEVIHRGDPPYLLESGWIPLLNGDNMVGWEYVPNTGQGGWTATLGVIWDERDNSANLKGISNSGDRIVNTVTDSKMVASDIVSTKKFGDMEIYIEFLVAHKSNSGLYVHGLYEVQILDSYGKDSLKPTNICGSIYNYEQQVNDKYVGGVAPRVRAERPAGQWQSYHILFQAPRFNNEGKKISNAKFLRVLHNGVLVHENVERKGLTRAGMKISEAATNPLMLQGNHGPIAYRNIYIRPLRPLSNQ